MINFITSTAVGLPQLHGWSQSFSHQQKIFATVAILGVNANNIGRELVDRFRQFDDNLTSEVFYHKLLDVLTWVRESGASLQLSIVYVNGKEMLLASINGEILLKRKDRVGVLVRTDAQLVIKQGKFNYDDLLVLLTKQAGRLSNLTQSMLRTGYRLDSVADALTVELHSWQDSSLSAVLLVEKDQKQPAKVEFTKNFSNNRQINSVKTNATMSQLEKLENNKIVGNDDFSYSLLSDQSSDQIQSVISDLQSEQQEKLEQQKKWLSKLKPIKLISIVNIEKIKNIQATILGRLVTAGNTQHTMLKIVWNQLIGLFNKFAVKKSLVVKKSLSRIANSDAQESDTQSLNSLPVDPSISKLADHPSATQLVIINQSSQPTHSVAEKQEPVLTTNNFDQNQLPNQQEKELNISLSASANTESVFNRINTINKLKLVFLILAELIKQLNARFFRVLPLLHQSNYKLDIGYQLQQQTRRRVRLFVSFVITLVFLAILVGGWQWLSQKQSQELQLQLGPILNQWHRAESLATTDLVQARVLMNQVLVSFDQLLLTYQNNPGVMKKLRKQLEEIQVFSASIAGNDKLSSLEVFFDLRLLGENLLANLIAIKGRWLFLLDSQQGKIIKLDIEQRQSRLLILPNNLVPVNQLTILNQFLVLNTKEGVVLVSELGDGKTQLLKTASEVSANANLAVSFGQYLYLLNPVKRNIYRYLFSNQSFSDPIGWLIDKQSLEFENLSSMAIDGDLWLATKNGQLLKYNKGQKQEFVFSGFTQLPDSNIIVFTSDKLNNLYILEPQRKRLAITNKQGQFIREINSLELATVTNFVVDEQEKTAYLLSGSIVFKISL